MVIMDVYNSVVSKFKVRHFKFLLVGEMWHVLSSVDIADHVFV